MFLEMLQIPNEILMEMLFFFELKDVLNFSQTCKKMERITNGNSTFWKSYLVFMYQKVIIFENSKIDGKLMNFVSKNFGKDWRMALKYLIFVEKEKKKQRKKIVFVGGNCCFPGKSSYLRFLKGDPFIENTAATIGAEFFQRKERIGDKEIKLQFWDVSSRTRMSSLQIYIRYSNVILIFYDITNKYTFKHAKELIEYIEKERNTKRNQISDFIYLIGNKIDLENQRKIFDYDIEALRTETKTKFNHFETSMKTKEGLNNLHFTLLQDIETQINNFRFFYSDINTNLWKTIILGPLDTKLVEKLYSRTLKFDQKEKKKSNLWKNLFSLLKK